MPKPLFRSAAECVLLAGLLATTPLAFAGQIKPLMKDMKYTYKAAMASQTVPELRGYVARLEDDVRLASGLRYTNDQATYDQGMQRLRQALAGVDVALQGNDLGAAKQRLQQIDGIKNHYHDLLD